MTIKAHKISVRRQRAHLLRDISLTLAPGQLIVVLGPNGAGKSTLLACLAGILAPSRGDVVLNGTPISQIDPMALARRRAVLSQNAAAPIGMTVDELVALGRLPYRGTAQAAEDNTVIAAVIAACGIGGLAGRYCHSLSGGELQRAHIARAMAQVWDERRNSERYLFFDEPTSGLDPAYQHQVLCHARVCADAGFGVLVVLHDLNHASMIADHVIMLDQGRLAAAGPPETIVVPSTVRDVYGIETQLVAHPTTGRPIVVPELDVRTTDAATASRGITHA